MTSSFWKFRPSALTCANNIYASASSRAELEDHYETDNLTAIQQGVEILPKKSQSSRLRTLQWNINSGRYMFNTRQVLSNKAIRTGIIDAIENANADVVVLNEYPNDRVFEKELKAIGYSYLDVASTDFPTAIATRLPVQERKEIRLSHERSALLIRLDLNDDQEDDTTSSLWVIGTHLDFVNGQQRQKEIKVLLKAMQEMGILSEDDHEEKTCARRDRIVLVGDLNQQRPQDYDPDEWERIRSGMIYRNSCQDDGVSTLLMNQGFVGAWDYTIGDNQKHGATRAITNWETSHPPATHWSGTIVDYSYGRNIWAATVSISPVGWSDHRMTSCDWKWN